MNFFIKKVKSADNNPKTFFFSASLRLSASAFKKTKVKLGILQLPPKVPIVAFVPQVPISFFILL